MEKQNLKYYPIHKLPRIKQKNKAKKQGKVLKINTKFKK
tara:strand:- start:1401 stop:1517 length:117 start_codon:yes stop_codon:yes gene_type:complete